MRGHVHRLAALVHVGHHFLVGVFALGRVVDGLQLFAVSELDGPFETHAAELARGPGHREQGRLEAAAGHGLSTEPVPLAGDDGHQRNVDVRAHHEHAGRMADEGRLLALRPHHDARAIAQAQDGDVEGVAQLHEAGALVRALGVDGAGQMSGIVGNHAERHPLHANERGDDAGPPTLAQLQHRADVGDAGYHLAHVVVAQPVLGDDESKLSLVRRVPVFNRSLKVRQVLLGNRHGLCLVLHRDVDHPVGHLHVHGPDLFGLENAEPAPLDHRRPADADVRTLRGDDHVATA